ncbi:MAG: hypothetical protein AB7I27_09865 [Bacteriovoracaceae bacterium]
MLLSTIDIAIVIIYIFLIFSIAIGANTYMRKHFQQFRRKGPKAIENQYLAGKTITFWEALLSIIATEFSALAFLTIPTYVYFENMSYMRFVIGACISRALIAFYFLPRVYGRGLTIFEVLARGIHNYPSLIKEGIQGKKTFATLYVFTKIIGVSIKLLGGAILMAEFFNTGVFVMLVMIAFMTYLYIILGGLKAVVRTDMIQAGIFILGGLAAHFIVGKMSSLSWGELFAFGWENGKFSLFSSASEGLAFLYGILAGIAYDAATHGVDQDLTQKLFGAQNIRTARKALAWSALGSFIVNLIFLSLGVILWAYYTKHGQPLPEPSKLFSSLIENYFPSPIKGLMVASILAACMSTLDSSINALSACLWNDIMNVDKSKMFQLYIYLDNFIITIAIIVVANIFTYIPGGSKFGMHFSYLSTAPLLAYFICRMLLSKYIKITYSRSLIYLCFLFCFLGMGINHFRFGFNPQLTIIWGIVFTIIAMWTYSKVNTLLNSSEKKI